MSRRRRFLPASDKPAARLDAVLLCAPNWGDGGVNCIYLLIDPRDETVRYVGKTTNPERRLFEHKTKTHYNWRLRGWIDDMFVAGVAPRMEVVTRVGACWMKAERAWISHCHRQGDILNLMEGAKPRKPKKHGQKRHVPKPPRGNIDKFGVYRRSPVQTAKL